MCVCGGGQGGVDGNDIGRGGDDGFIGNGDVEGNGSIILYIARQNANHFVPLLRRNAVDDDNSASEYNDNSAAERELPDVPLNDSGEKNAQASERLL